MSAATRAKQPRTLREFLERYDDVEEMSGFWWCEGAVPGGYSWYCCVILVPHTPKRRTFVETFRATSAYALYDTLTVAGVDPGTPERIAKLCESAPGNPRIPRFRGLVPSR